MFVAERVMARVLVDQRRQQPGGKIRIIGLIEKASPRVGVEAARALAESRVFVQAFGGERSQSKKDEGRIIRRLVGGDGEVVLPTRRMRLGAAETERKLGMDPRCCGCPRSSGIGSPFESTGTLGSGAVRGLASGPSRCRSMRIGDHRARQIRGAGPLRRRDRQQEEPGRNQPRGCTRPAHRRAASYLE